MLSINRVDLPAYLVEKLRECGYNSAIDIMTSSPLFLMSQNFNNAEIQLISHTIAEKNAPKCMTALEMFYIQNDKDNNQSLRYISTGSSVIDEALNGGIDFKSVTEIVGISGVGKTQFCLSCCVENVLSKSGSVIFIDTELKFDPLRLSDLLEYRIAHSGVSKIDTSVEYLLDKVKVCRCNDIMHSCLI